MKIYEDFYRKQKALVLENEILRTLILPGTGGKMASLVYLPDGKELLWQNPDESFHPVEYGDSFSQGEAAGFDDMFPNINECYYPDWPWKGTSLPDHGEVWSLPWRVISLEGSAVLEVSGVRLPYTLRKELSLDGSTVRFRYRVENPSPFPINFVYATHPLFNVDSGDCIRIPQGMNRIINAVPSKVLPEYGKEYAYPETLAEGDKLIDLSCVEPENNSYKKYYFSEPTAEGWASLERKKAGLEIRMEYSKEVLPWLGIWINEGGWEDQLNLALEPSSAPMDDPVAARLWGKECVLEADSVMEWQIDIGILKA